MKWLLTIHNRRKISGSKSERPKFRTGSAIHVYNKNVCINLVINLERKTFAFQINSNSPVGLALCAFSTTTNSSFQVGTLSKSSSYTWLREQTHWWHPTVYRGCLKYIGKNDLHIFGFGGYFLCNIAGSWMHFVNYLTEIWSKRMSLLPCQHDGIHAKMWFDCSFCAGQKTPVNANQIL